MSTNSIIKTTILHEKVPQIPDTVNVRNIFSNELPDSIWSGIDYPFIAYPAKNGNQIHYTNVSSLDLDSSVSSNLGEYTELSALAWDESVSACQLVAVGAFFGDFSVYLEQSPDITVTDDCGCILDVKTPRYENGYLEFSLDFSGSSLNTTVSSEFRPDEDPFPTTLNGAEDSLIEKVKFFDIEDFYGKGILFENKESSTSFILNKIFTDTFTNKIQDRITNFGSYTNDVDISNIDTLNTMGEMMGLERDTFFEDSPFELGELITLGSIDWTDAFGFDDIYSKFNANNLGEVLNLETVVSAGERLFYQDCENPDDGIDVLVVPEKYDPSETEYALSGLDIDNIENIDLYKFWRIDDDYEEIVANRLVTSLLSGIPDEDFWEILIERKIQKNLLDKLVY